MMKVIILCNSKPDQHSNAHNDAKSCSPPLAGNRWIGIAIIATLLTGSLATEASSAESENQLNVLFIAIDDLNDWVGFLDGNLRASTPQMNELAKRGCNFTNAHCDVPVCSPSRVSVMSGVTATKHGSYELGPGYGQLPALAHVPTIQRYFKNHGYRTFSGGKVLHHGFPGRLATDIDHSLGRPRNPKPPETMNRAPNWSRAWDWGKYPEDNAQMGDFQLANKAGELLKKEFDQPFFMSIGFFRPHVPLHVPASWFEIYDQQSLILPNNPKSDLDDLPENFLNINTYAAAPTHAEVVSQNAQRSLTLAYLASTSFVDHCVGILLNALQNGPHADNTLIVLWSDHGFHLGEKQHWAKRTLWEESTRVPLLMAGPGIKPGMTCQQPASLLDIYPTLVELCGLPTNRHLDGTSLVPQLINPATPRKQPAITSSYHGNHAIRNRDWRLIVYKDGSEELYDHRNDPDEFHNLAADPKYKTIRDELASWLPENPVPEVKARSERFRSNTRNETRKQTR